MNDSDDEIPNNRSSTARSRGKYQGRGPRAPLLGARPKTRGSFNNVPNRGPDFGRGRSRGNRGHGRPNYRGSGNAVCNYSDDGYGVPNSQQNIGYGVPNSQQNYGYGVSSSHENGRYEMHSGHLGSLDALNYSASERGSSREGGLPSLIDLRSDAGQRRPRGRSHARGRGNWKQHEFGGRGRPQTHQENNNGERDEEREHTGGHNAKRLYPVGINVLKEWTTQPPDLVIHSLLSDRSGVPQLLAETKIPDDKLVLFIKVLASASTCTGCRQSLIEIFTMIFTEDFVNKLVTFHISLMTSQRTDVKSFLEDQLQLLKVLKKTLINQAKEMLPTLLQTVKIVIPKLKNQSELNELMTEYEQLLALLLESQKPGPDIGERKRRPFADRLADLDDLEPEDDYRDIPIEPTDDELLQLEAPLIRRNITEGAYRDVHNYLDVQFRLLREDFIRPLREGIRQVKSGLKGVKDVRVYRKVKFQDTQIVRGELVHFVKLNFPKNFKVEFSKRLLFGNVMCFSADNFASSFLATVAGHDPDKLKNGLVGIKLLSVSKLDASLEYTAVESRTFFIAYKHVLRALQFMDENTLPLVEHIVFAEKAVRPPQYVLNAANVHYDLRVVLQNNYMKDQDKTDIFPKSNTIPPPNNRPDLQHIPITNAEVEMWPRSSDFGLDRSQRKALHSALTKRLVVIQGPPGTGKTYLGLKITQVLLHNSQAWSRKETEIRHVPGHQNRRLVRTVDVDVTSPILVICYTNHALDQFLEGMLNFTKRIIRIGNRSKSESIQSYQINEFVSYLKEQRRLPSNLRNAGSKIRSRVNDAETKLKSQYAQLQEVAHDLGLLSFGLLNSYGVIPPNIVSKLERGQLYRSWMLPIDQPWCMNLTYDPRQVWSMPAQMNGDPKTGPSAADDKEDDEEWHDALEMLREAENERIIDVEEDDLQTGTALILPRAKSYEVKRINPKEFETSLFRQLNDGHVTREDCEITLDKFYKEQRILGELLQFTSRDVSSVANATINEHVDIFRLAYKDRCLLYCLWRHKLLAKMRETIRPHEANIQRLMARAQEVKNSEYLHVARQADVVGLTTTGAAQFQDVVQELKPRIVIIEEAAEILEAHVIASLNTNCEHLILIGDHQQLKPSPAVYQLAKHYGLDTSLFERMINNGVAYETLKYQHRMRPEISSLLVPAIYPELEDHASVQGRDHIRGVERSVFFVSHLEKELAETDDNNSHSNVHEAEFIMRLARHLVLQGYDPTLYSGQFFLLRKEQRKYSPTCDGMRVTIVDNYQGEENDIILLSLVRSNDSGNVGFLKIENRVCVALSRAKLGLFIIGNMKQLCQSSPLWIKIEKSLTEIDGLGDALVLKCQSHPDRKVAVKTGEDFRTMSPEGGCTQPCSGHFPMCGHKCPRICHPDDPSHTESKCREPCERKCDRRGHPCPAFCYETCPPCTVDVVKELPCGHSHLVPCHLPRKSFLCPSKVDKTIEKCRHVIEMPCHQNPAKKKCPKKCDVRLECGHSCDQTCHVDSDPEHVKYLCQSPCSRNMKGCSQDHKCTLYCWQTCLECNIKVEKKLPCGHKAQLACQDPVDSYKCKERCRKALPECGHNCYQRCSEPCGGCRVLVSKNIDQCGHQIKMECGKTPNPSMCNSKDCGRRLPCGHKCPRPCKEPCGGCQKIVPASVRCIVKDHELLVPCSSLPLTEPDYSQCRVPCGASLKCGHRCKGSCGSCLHGRFHLPCAEKCGRTLVCGHVCKSPCSAACPPCQEKCRWKCSHSRCNKICGAPCTPCQEPCSSECEHQAVRCSKKCGEACDQEPCEEPCPKTLACGHPCVGLCGDPCPPLCRECNFDKLTEFELICNEKDPDARFVLLQDCGHTIEHDGLSGWLHQTADNSVQMKQCPRCKTPIYNNRRFNALILETYKDVQTVLFKHSGQQVPTLKQIVEKFPKNMVNDAGQPGLELDNSLFFLDCISKSQMRKTVSNYMNALQSSKLKGPKARSKEFKLDAAQLHLLNFQADVVIMAKKIHDELDRSLKKDLERVMERVMSQNVSVVSQFMEEVHCELQRIRYVSIMKSVRTRGHNDRFLETVREIDALMDPTRVFTAQVERDVKALLKICETFIGSLGISNEERLLVLKAMHDVKKGAWYKCPNGHIYCITECGGAMQTAVCPDCGAGIGGGSHRLRSDNRVASEMDGATAHAWPQ
ncbi:NFX1-type zinc finger-containing protein 1-like isoform X2 [Hyalella azteca]|uniref:NFX1-type zinc finger-containing protein 1-like isoform X2 n=1 Tax=Hyalella azteca TaxID=294128 RepID=A0A8B7NNC7_HYAAZ|nr:NFX1-type zinc finger-containing protein 1-like isoform X2 [Hyalella azteca]